MRVSGVGGIARRVPMLFALLAVCVLGLLAMSWRAYAELQDAQAWRDDTREVLTDLDRLERATAPQPALVQCAAHGSAAAAAAEPPNPAPIIERLRKRLQDNPVQQGALDELPVLVEVLRRAYIEPLVAACRGGRVLGVERALDLAAVGVHHRGRVQQQLERLRAVELERLTEREARLQSRTDDAARLFALFAVGTVLLAVVATVGLRAFTARLADSNRRLRREATERGVVQEQLRESQRRLEMTLDHIPDGVIAFDAGTRVQWINPAAEVMFGRSRAGMRAQPVSLLIPELDHRTEWPDTVPPEDAPAATPWHARRETMYGLRADGAEFPIEVALVQTRVGGERVGVCVCRDLSQLERMERMKHEFVSMVSHELRTPLTSIRGSLAMLADGMAGELTGPVHRLVGLAHQNSERLVALVNDILDFEKLRAGEVRMELAPLDLVDEARAALESCEGYAHQHRVATRLQSAGAVPAVGDAQRLQQVLANLLSNAIKFSPEGGEVTVHVDAGGGEPRLWVIDQGPGVPAAFVEQLFEPFAQASNLQTRKRGGTGLGLAISRAMMEQMGGRIGLEPPEPGRGAVFWIALPPAPVLEQALG
jgi:NtrC-family two-component system sensor histidine kinase KinB